MSRQTNTQALEAHVARIVENWPPLSPEQLTRVAGLLRGDAK